MNCVVRKRPNYRGDILSWVLNEKELPMQYLSEGAEEKADVSKSQEEETVI